MDETNESLEALTLSKSSKSPRKAALSKAKQVTASKDEPSETPILKLSTEIVELIHLFASLADDGKPSALPRVCRAWRSLTKYSTSQSLKLRVESVQLQFHLDEVIYGHVVRPEYKDDLKRDLQLRTPFLDHLRFGTLAWITSHHLNSYPRYIAITAKPTDATCERLENFGRWHPRDITFFNRPSELCLTTLNSRIRTLLQNATNLKYLCVDLEHPLELYTWKANGCDVFLTSSDKWAMKSLAHLRASADDKSVTRLISMCVPGTLKALDINQDFASKAFQLASSMHGHSLKKLSITLSRKRRCRLGPSVHQIRKGFPHLEWLVIHGHPPRLRAPVSKEDDFRVWAEQLENERSLWNDLDRVGRELRRMRNLTHLAVTMYDDDGRDYMGNARDTRFSVAHCASALFNGCHRLRTVCIMGHYPQYWYFDREECQATRAMMEDTKLRDPDASSEFRRYPEDKGCRGRDSGFPWSLVEDPWEYTYRESQDNEKEFAHFASGPRASTGASVVG